MKLILVLSLILLCGCNALSPDDTGVAPSVETTTSISEASSEVEYDPWEMLEYSPKRLLVEDEYTLLARDGENSGEVLICLHYPQDGFEKIIAISDCDHVVSPELADSQYGYPDVVYDPETKTASIVVEKSHYELDFVSGEYTLEIEYRLQDCRPQYLKDTSPDGLYELYVTYIAYGGNGECVVVDTQSDDIWYLTNISTIEQAIFCNNYGVLVNRYYELELLDMHTGAPRPNAPDFVYGQSDLYDDGPIYCTVGIAYDHQQKKTLIAYREDIEVTSSNWDVQCEVYVAVFDDSGAQINNIETGFYMQPRLAIVPNRIEFDTVDSGMAVLSTINADNGEALALGSIQY